MYSSEAAFSRALSAHLTKIGYFVQRIETGSTGRGVPDMFVACPDGNEYWIELKNRQMSVPARGPWTVEWRAGQQAWMLNKFRVSRKPCLTMVSSPQGIFLIPMNKRYTGNQVTHTDIMRHWNRIGEVTLV